MGGGRFPLDSRMIGKYEREDALQAACWLLDVAAQKLRESDATDLEAAARRLLEQAWHAYFGVDQCVGPSSGTGRAGGDCGP